MITFLCHKSGRLIATRMGIGVIKNPYFCAYKRRKIVEKASFYLPCCLPVCIPLAWYSMWKSNMLSVLFYQVNIFQKSLVASLPHVFFISPICPLVLYYTIMLAIHSCAHILLFQLDGFFFYSPFSFSFANLALTLVSSSSPTDTLKAHCSLLDSRRSNLGHSFQFGRDGNFNKDYDRKNTVKVCIQYCLILW